MERTGVRGERGYGRSAGVLVLACGHAAFGQAQGMGHWISEVTTQDGDSIVEPGETATVSLWMDMNPSVGQMLPDGTTVHGFGGGIIDVLGALNAEKGQILGWTINDALYVGIDGTTDGTSIFNVGVGQFLEAIDFSDPIFLMSFEWAPTEFTSFDVSYDLDVETFLGPGIIIWKDDGTFEAWPVIQHELTFQVVPAPSALAFVLGLAPIMARRRRRMSACVGAFACGSAAFGQAQGMGHWISEVTTQDGDSIVEPGETATVSLWMDMDPSVGEMLPDGTSVLGLGGGNFDIVGGTNADKGSILGWEVNRTLSLGLEGITDGVSIFDIALFQLPFSGPFDDDDPIFLLSFEWEPSTYGFFQAKYAPSVESNDAPGLVVVWKNDGDAELWPTDKHQIAIMVVPSPSGMGALLGVIVLATRSRRA